LRVTFDSNVWEKVVAPDEYPDDPNVASLRIVHHAIREGRLSGFICETFATLEAIRKGTRGDYLHRRAEDMVKVTWRDGGRNEQTGNNVVRGTFEIGGASHAHPGLHPLLAQRLQQAFALGFRLIPISRVGTARPPEIDDEAFRIPLTSEQRENIWGFLDHISRITQTIEREGVGFATIESIARRIQQRENLCSIPWYVGLDRPCDAAEKREIDRAFAEWADGDTVAVHIAYQLDVLCTQDRGRSARRSVFNAPHRAWLAQEYGTDIIDIETLAMRLFRAGKAPFQRAG
jgi:hypothetical protein